MSKVFENHYAIEVVFARMVSVGERTGELGQTADRPLESGFTLRKLRADFGIEPLDLTASLESFREEVELHGDGR